MNNKSPVENKTLAIVGTGLIGCSMAEGLRDAFEEIIGVDNNTGHLQEALDRGYIDKSMSLVKAVNRAGVVVLTVPVDVVINLLPQVLDNIDQQSVVIDAGSVKAAICGSVAGHRRRSQFVAAHPMAGLAISGPDAADAGIFMNRKVIICEHEKSSRQALDTALFVFEKLGLNTLYMEPDFHDLRVARVSHLPQVVAYCLSAINDDQDGEKQADTGIASTGYESATRLASSPSGMWIPIIQYNRENLTSSLGEMIDGLSDMRDMIDKGMWDKLEKLIDKANKSRETFLTAYKQA
jgi:prephenate dehydrogenase